MSRTGTKITQPAKPSYFYSIISITIVLFMLGLAGVLLLQAQNLSAYFKENIEVTLILSDNATYDEAQMLETKLKTEPFVKSAVYVSKEDAAKRYMQQNTEDFRKVLDYNPLFAAINLYLKAPYANADSLRAIKARLQKTAVIEDVFYQEALLDMINVNAGKLGFILLVMSIIFLITAFALIDNTIKLAMYANRFLIKSMQLVGATRWFIAGPFIRQSIYNGIVSGIAACLILAMLLLFAQWNLPELSALYDPLSFLLLCVVVVLIGITISWWSTKQAVLKYIQMQLDELY